jgi:hypothetical protein
LGSYTIIKSIGGFCYAAPQQYIVTPSSKSFWSY